MAKSSTSSPHRGSTDGPRRDLSTACAEGITRHEQSGPRYGVVVQSGDLLALSTTLIAPTSTNAAPATFRPAVEIAGQTTRAMVEQTRVVAPERLGPSAGLLTGQELSAVETALALVLDL